MDLVHVNYIVLLTCPVVILLISSLFSGWLYTFQHYYNIYTKSTLDNMVDKLSGHPEWRFIWSEIIFLSKWWSESSIIQRQKFKRFWDFTSCYIMSSFYFQTFPFAPEAEKLVPFPVIHV